MSDLNNLTSKIIEDAENTANDIIEESKKEEKRISQSFTEKGEAEKNKILKQAHIDAAAKAERAISNTKLKVRNDLLEAKQNLISKVFSTALDNLYKMSDIEYKEFMKNYILALDIQGDEEIFIENKRQNIISEDFIKELNSSLIKNNKKGELKLGSVNRNITGGFVLVKNGIEINCTYESLLEYYRDDLEGKIVETLFH
ncbi:V-type ATP synthase subunit E family protein [Clostridium sp. JN-9]|uniref:V-type ATP synthase subunit E n=1 Tax=Clostridium sp. JN-9 TaxID=2507159 RepID=UPI000FFDFCCF|nr:V-type ATP synthase subunit E family protein [Clostridium sp. JN-9]QAT40285.1 V-type ATP synthase subunit E [Clostridium sp. JN-9]